MTHFFSEGIVGATLVKHLPWGVLAGIWKKLQLTEIQRTGTRQIDQRSLSMNTAGCEFRPKGSKDKPCPPGAGRPVKISGATPDVPENGTSGSVRANAHPNTDSFTEHEEDHADNEYEFSDEHFEEKLRLAEEMELGCDNDGLPGQYSGPWHHSDNSIDVVVNRSQPAVHGWRYVLRSPKLWTRGFRSRKVNFCSSYEMCADLMSCFFSCKGVQIFVTLPESISGFCTSPLS